ncbi:Vitamin B12 import ATP-binding protein BtuD [Terrisporobacter petrolearius]|uniref:Vitamin B12 import ATP-binding protein BtuD n=1 Tax=Terrisporobacter petrolearius TaxID=1460447 RepID=A0ABZ3F961_9FIRM
MLRLENISKKFDNFELKEISFHLKEGFIMGLIGSNGSGKTTLIKLIMNLLQADEGKIYFQGKDILENPKEFKENIGFVYDNLYFYENLKVKDFKNVVSCFYSKFDSYKFDSCLLKFKIDKNSKIKNLSKGQNIKLMLANAISHNAKLLILDEPTSGLDPIFRKEMIEILQEELENGDKSVIISTHITQDLSMAADYITFINNGELIFSEDKEIISESYKIIRCEKKDLDNLQIELINKKHTDYYSEGLFIDEENNINGLNIQKASLEDIIYYYGKEL